MFTFGDIVVVDDDQIGVIVKCWGTDNYEVYVRSYNGIRAYKTKDMHKYIYGKQISDEEIEFYK